MDTAEENIWTYNKRHNKGQAKFTEENIWTYNKGQVKLSNN